MITAPTNLRELFCSPDHIGLEVMKVVLKLTRKQSAKVRKLVRRECCNCVDDNCILLDDGEPCRCVQLDSLYGIYCKYFLTAVLPADKELYEEILQQNYYL